MLLRPEAYIYRIIPPLESKQVAVYIIAAMMFHYGLREREVSFTDKKNSILWIERNGWTRGLFGSRESSEDPSFESLVLLQIEIA